MFIVVQQGADEDFEVLDRLAIPRLETAFAQVCCRAGFVYAFEQIADGWRLVLTDGERPECSPEAITSTFVKRADAQRDLMSQAVDGRLRGWAAIPLDAIQRQLQAAE